MPRSVFTDAYKAMIQTLVEARRSANVTQVELAERLGKPQPWVSNYENCTRRLDVIEFIAICRAIDHDPGALFRVVLKKAPANLEI
ncbi:helix-turn-helix transcriptional regulator [Glycocaulis profundi]|nr:helix-turn-helix transcriptional regulator [Glycocaulis profundi]